MKHRSACISALSAVVAGLALSALAGWALGIPRLAGIMPGMIPMAPSTALLSALYAGALLLRCHAPSRRATRRVGFIIASCGAVSALGLLILNLRGIHSGVEHLGFHITQVQGKVPLGHMSPLTAVCFLLASASLLAGSAAGPFSPARVRATRWPAALLGTISLVLLLSYLYGAPILYGTGTIPPAATTSLAFLALSLALLALPESPSRPLPGARPPAPYVMLAVLATLSAGIVLTGYVYSQRVTRASRQGVEDQLAAFTGMKAADLVAWRDTHMENAAMLQRNTDLVARIQRYLQDTGDADSEERLTRWLDLVRCVRGDEQVYLFDSRGEPRLALPDGTAPPSPLLMTAVAAVLRSGRIALVDLHRDAPGNPAPMVLLVPIPDGAEGQPPVAALALRMDPRADLYPALRRWPSSHRTAETLLLRGGDPAFVVLNERGDASAADPNRHAILPPEANAIVEAALGRNGMVTGGTRHGVPVLACVRAVPGTPWFVLVSLDLAVIEAPLLYTLWMLLGGVSTLLIGVGVVAAMQWRRETLQAYRQRLADVEALRESEELFRAVFDRSTVGKALTAPDGRLLRVNAALAGMLGMSIDGLQHINFAAITHPDDMDESRECIRRLLANERSSFRMEKRYRHRDGHYVWADVSTTLLRGLHDEPLYFITVILEITERRQAEDASRADARKIRRLNAELELRVHDRTAQLEDANKELEAFSYSVSHDLRAPLRHVQGYVDMLARDTGSQLSEQGRRYMQTITDASREMGELIDDLLAFSRMGRADLAETDIHMNRLVQDALHHLEPVVRGRNIVWSLADLPDVRADPAMLALVLSNLLSNAVKFTRPRDPARIELGCAGREGDRLVLFVRDNGVGFDPRYTHKLFGVFQRLHRAEEFEGTGIGLSSVRRIITRHGGRTWAEGEIDKGATFYFTLKAADPGMQEKEAGDDITH